MALGDGREGEKAGRVVRQPSKSQEEEEEEIFGVWSSSMGGLFVCFHHLRTPGVYHAPRAPRARIRSRNTTASLLRWQSNLPVSPIMAQVRLYSHCFPIIAHGMCVCVAVGNRTRQCRIVSLEKRPQESNPCRVVYFVTRPRLRPFSHRASDHLEKVSDVIKKPGECQTWYGPKDDIKMSPWIPRCILYSV